MICITIQIILCSYCLLGVPLIKDVKPLQTFKPKDSAGMSSMFL